MNVGALLRKLVISVLALSGFALICLSTWPRAHDIGRGNADDAARRGNADDSDAVVAELFRLPDAAKTGFTPSNINISNQPGNQSEVSLVINPTNPDNIVVVGNVPGGGMGSFYSLDGGLSWNYTPLDATVDGATHTVKRIDPTVSFDDDGNVYACYFTGVDSPDVREMFVAKSFDGGATYPQCSLVLADDGIDKEIIGAGPDPFDPSQQNVYVAYRLLVGKDRECRLAASYDGGLTWPTNVVINDQSIAGIDSTMFAMPAVGPSGELYVVWDDFIDRDIADQGYSHIMMDVSFDGGLTWGTDVVIDRTDVSWGHANGHTPSLATRYHINAQPDRGVLAVPSIAVDRTGGPYHGRIYVAYTIEGWAGTGDLDVVLRSSDDHGATWSEQTHIIDELAFSSQFLPWMSVDNCPGSQGRLAVGWLDTRLDPLNCYADAYMAFSEDGGATFSKNRRISEAGSNVSTNNPDRSISNYLEYIGVDICANIVHMVWPSNHLNWADLDYFTNRIDLVNDLGVVYAWNGGEGDWHTPSNWTPEGVPGKDDWAVVEAGTPNLAVNDSLWMLELRGGSIEGVGNLVVLDSMEWSGGAIAGAGSLLVDAGAGLNISGPAFLDREMVSEGTIYWRAEDDFQLGTTTTLASNGLFLDETTADNALAWQYPHVPLFVNNGVYLKTDESQTMLTTGFRNDGTVRLQRGTFYIYQGDRIVDTGAYRVHPDAELHIRCVGNFREMEGPMTGGGTVRLTGNGYNNAIAVGDTFSIAGQVFFTEGTHWVKPGAVPLDFGRRQMYLRARLAFDSGRSVAVDSLLLEGHHDYAFVGGEDEFHIRSHFQWDGGSLQGADTFFIDEGAVMEIGGDVRTSRRLACNGATRWLSGVLYLSSSAVFENNGTFRDMTTGDALLYGHQFVNNLIYLKENETLTTAQILFFNATPGGLSGYGRMDFTNLDNQGEISPGVESQSGRLTIGGGYPTASSTWTRFDVNGHTPESEHDVLEIDGVASLGGTLFVVVDPGFAPAHDDTFTVMRFPSRVGEFERVVSSANVGCDFFTVAYTDTSASLVYQSLVGSPPVAARDVATTLENISCEIDVLSNDADPDGDDLVVAWVGDPLHGLAAVIDDTLVSYAPELNYVGLDSLPYAVSDEHGCVGEAQWIVVDVLDPTFTDSVPRAVFALHQNYPNPANPSTTIEYTLASDGRVKLKIFDVRGRQVATLVDRIQSAGMHRVSFHAAGLASGIYYYRLTSPEGSQVRRMAIIK